MKKTLLVTLEVDCSDLSGDELYEAAALECVEPKDLERLKDIPPSELAWLVAECFPNLGMQFFEGSNMYAKFIEGRVRTAEFIRYTPKRERRKIQRAAAKARALAEQQKG